MNHKELTPEAVMIELNRLKTDTYPTTDFDRRSAALERAKRAVRKVEIKMKVISDGTDDMDFTRCPCCESILGQVGDIYFEDCYPKHCEHCGQALDWGGNPDE